MLPDDRLHINFSHTESQTTYIKCELFGVLLIIFAELPL